MTGADTVYVTKRTTSIQKMHWYWSKQKTVVGVGSRRGTLELKPLVQNVGKGALVCFRPLFTSTQPLISPLCKNYQDVTQYQLFGLVCFKSTRSIASNCIWILKYSKTFPKRGRSPPLRNLPPDGGPNVQLPLPAENSFVCKEAFTTYKFFLLRNILLSEKLTS